MVFNILAYQTIAINKAEIVQSSKPISRPCFMVRFIYYLFRLFWFFVNTTNGYVAPVGTNSLDFPEETREQRNEVMALSNMEFLFRVLCTHRISPMVRQEEITPHGFDIFQEIYKLVENLCGTLMSEWHSFNTRLPVFDLCFKRSFEIPKTWLSLLVCRRYNNSETIKNSLNRGPQALTVTWVQYYNCISHRSHCSPEQHFLVSLYTSFIYLC